jgi:probable rRNA maturation factor
VIDVEIEDAAWTVALPDAEALTGAAAEAALAKAPATKAGGPDNLTVLLTDDGAIRELNARFRKQDKPTNVLSFPALPNPENHLGDVALAYGVCARSRRAGQVRRASPAASGGAWGSAPSRIRSRKRRRG